VFRGDHLAHVVTDKIAVGLKRVGFALLALAGLSIFASMTITSTPDDLIRATVISVLAFAGPGCVLCGLGYWLDRQTAAIEEHRDGRQSPPKEADAKHPFKASALGYAIALASVAIAWAIRAAIDPILPGSVPFITFFIAIAFTGWYGGYGPSVLCVALSATIAAYFYMEPKGSFVPATATDAMRLGSFVFIGLVVGGLTAALHAALLRVTELAERARLLEANGRRDPDSNM